MLAACSIYGLIQQCKSFLLSHLVSLSLSSKYFLFWLFNLLAYICVICPSGIYQENLILILLVKKNNCIIGCQIPSEKKCEHPQWLQKPGSYCFIILSIPHKIDFFGGCFRTFFICLEISKGNSESFTAHGYFIEQETNCEQGNLGQGNIKWKVVRTCFQ